MFIFAKHYDLRNHNSCKMCKFSIFTFILLKLYPFFMYVNEDNQKINKRDIFHDTYKPWKFPISYRIEKELQFRGTVIKKALHEIQSNTCIQFYENITLVNDTQGIVFRKSSEDCSSGLGLVYSNQTQIIHLTDECSKSKGVVLHEVGHALGLVHEQSRTDRDKYVIVYKNYIKESDYVYFKIQNHTDFKNFSTGYDYGSVMHYAPYDFSTSYWHKALTSKLHIAYDKMMGQRSYMSFNDYKKINFAYCNKCNNTTTTKKIKEKNKEKVNGKENKKGNKNETENTIQCLNGGYFHYDNCTKCICSFGYTGDLCNRIVESSKECNTTKFNATSKMFYHWIAGPYKCYFYLTAQKRKKIQIVIYYSSAPYKDVCTEDISHQIKYLKDKGSTGLLLCSWHRDIVNVTSENNKALIFFNGNTDNALIQFGFREVD
uniref:Metalloendopeptidase n=1 Tax=Strongyloides papillosus TaxID=174720 RepID=A0A0N5BU64_STREA